MNSSPTKDCPYCKEVILAEAVKCKHCGSFVASSAPAHGGTCPYCKEQINPEAVRCKHCGSTLSGPLSLGTTSANVPPSSLGLPAGLDWNRAANRVSTRRAGIVGIPGPFGPIVIIGGPIDTDPWYCEGHYSCIELFGTQICVWVCEVV